MLRYVLCIFLLPVFMATAQETVDLSPIQNQITNIRYPDALMHQSPATITRLKQYHDELELLKRELAELHDQSWFDKKDISIRERIKTRKHRLTYLGDTMADLEEQLRVTHRQLDKQISSIRYCTADKVMQENYLKNIESYFKIPDYKRLYVDHNDYGRFFFKLNVGYEYNSISGILEESSPRIGLLIYSHFGRMPYQSEYGLGDYGYQLFANLILSSNTDTQTSTSPVVTDEQIEDNLGINISVYKPVLRNKIRPDVSHLFGPMIDIGTKQTDQTTDIQSQYFLGVRSAMSPEHHIDVLYGRSVDQESRRLLIRGQMPVASLSGGSRIYIGMKANMAVANKQADENDVFSVYVTWNIDFLDLFTTGG